MATHNADNERIKRRYFVFLKEAGVGARSPSDVLP